MEEGTSPLLSSKTPPALGGWVGQRPKNKYLKQGQVLIMIVVITEIIENITKKITKNYGTLLKITWCSPGFMQPKGLSRPQASPFL